MKWHLPSKYILLLFFPLILFHAENGLAQGEKKPARTIMLILGSANLETSKKRVEAGYNLYKSETHFDYIIVSGGCGAHASSLCEASEMKKMLVEKGVPDQIIFKEEKSKSTAQNYCYSRELKKPNGSNIINTGDTLYVVSNHWHAMSVSGCFTENDLVDSKYFIEGNITPPETGKADYTDIYKNCINDPNYCEKVLWPKVDVSFHVNGLNPKKKGEGDLEYLLVNDMVFIKNSLGETSSKLSAAFPFLPEEWNSGMDAAFYNKHEHKVYFFKASQYVRFKLGSSTLDKGYPKPIESLVKNLPEDWFGGYIDAASFDSKTKEIYFFKGGEYLKFSSKSGKIIEGFPRAVTSLLTQWPFKWGTGELDAASFDRQKEQLLLYRGQEKLILSFDGQKVKDGGDIPRKTELTAAEN